MSRSDERRAAVFLCYQRDVTGAPIEELVGRGIPADADTKRERPLPAPISAFTRELVEGVEAERDELDRLIDEQALGWSLERIAPLERAILRVALLEMLHREDVPDEVAIDEAVETAKLYCGRDTPGFVNGILGGVLKRVRNA